MELLCNVTHETALCCNPQIHDFTADRKHLTDRAQTNTLAVMFLQKYKEKQFSCGHSILTEGVFVTCTSETSTLTKRDRKQLNIFERKVYRRILGPVYDNEKENWRILTNKEIYARVKKTYYNRDYKVK